MKTQVGKHATRLLGSQGDVSTIPLEELNFDETLKDKNASVKLRIDKNEEAYEAESKFLSDTTQLP